MAFDRQEFVEELKAVGRSRYHDRHPFHQAMNSGLLSLAQLRGWALNRFYYQRNIPRKDAAILSNCPLREVRRVWLERITDHDGRAGNEGGIEGWLRLAEALGLSREDVLDDRDVVPGVRFAVDAYVQFAKTKPWPVAVASSLTELFAPELMSNRIKAFEEFYSWVPEWGLTYFRSRPSLARRDAQHALEITVKYCNTSDLQRAAIAALAFKCDVLWAMLDAISSAYGCQATIDCATSGMSESNVQHS